MRFQENAMLRRDFISFLAGALVAYSRDAIAQSPSKVYRVGTLLPGAPIDEKSPLGAILLKKLEQHGYALGQKTSRTRHAERVVRSVSLARLSGA
jgi:putative ABC transport system substrate-binding protein